MVLRRTGDGHHAAAGLASPKEPKEKSITQIAIVLYPGFTALDFIGPYEVLRNLPDT